MPTRLDLPGLMASLQAMLEMFQPFMQALGQNLVEHAALGIVAIGDLGIDSKMPCSTSWHLSADSTGLRA